MKEDWKPIKKSNKAIPVFSESRKERNKKYKILRDEYFLEHPVCEFPGCNSNDITLHHGKGRNGDLLFDKRWFKSLCLIHHRFVEDFPLEAQKLGLSFSRLNKKYE